MKIIAAASKLISGVPPISSTTAPDAIAAAEPHSAWHPPSAPEKVAFIPIIIPIAEAANNPVISSSSVLFNNSPALKITAGNIPHEPAVGHATILPIEPLTSEDDIAIAIAVTIPLPIRDLPELLYCCRR